MQNYVFAQGKVQIMGILNVTPDSFSEGGADFALDSAVARALEIQAAGADILDIGAQSTRPGHVPVPPEEEIARLVPVLEALRGRLAIPVSVDTYVPAVAEVCLRRGARIINDVSGVVCKKMAETVKRHGAGWVLMHGQNDANTASAYVPDVVTAVAAALKKLLDEALAFGLERAQLCLDPGIGFGKTMEDNLRLLAGTGKLRVPGVAFLVGASRKRVIGGALNERDPGTLAAHTIAQWGGADLLRVHDVRAARLAADFVLRMQAAASFA
ncbi:MAG: dihydropteroate synthase [Oscillospiraceae bacterium]|jgi:dihydropteroate synthase|nr:dihydropteroate synthase [Oscillospiraceae bacterium]